MLNMYELGDSDSDSVSVLVRCKIIKGDNTKHIDRWTLDFSSLKHRARDPACRWQPEIALRYLRANYPADVVERIVNRSADHERGRLLVLCLSCEPFVKDDKLQVSARGEHESRTRLCDYSVDPVSVSEDQVRERWQDHTVDFEQLQGSGDLPSSGYVLGRSLHDFAPAVAALTDCEEMVAYELFGETRLRCCLLNLFAALMNISYSSAASVSTGPAVISVIDLRNQVVCHH